MKRKRVIKDIYTMADLHGLPDIAPIRLGVIGDPVTHSISPQMQNAALSDAKIDMQYARFHILPDELHEAFNRLRDLEFVGFNLTLPHKIAAPEFVDRIDEDAKQIGAINVVKISSGKTHGFNTDGAGFARAIREEFSIDLRDLRVMVLGAGGAARAIALECAKSHCERLVIANGTIAKGERLIEKLRKFFEGPKVFGPVPRLQAIAWEEAAFQFQIANIDLIVNATPVGLNRGDPSPISSRLLAPHLMVYDTIYSTTKTPLVSAAMEAGTRTADGLSMLLHQGALAFELWFDRPAPIEVMRTALL